MMSKINIISFVCDWCSLQSADFIGLTKIFFPRKISFIRVACSGRVNPEIVTMAFKRGADGVIVMGCEKGACNYRTGNFQASRWIDAYRKVLKYSGLNPNRLKLHLESDTEIMQIYDQFYKDIEKLGAIGTEINKAKQELKGIFDVIEMTLLNEDIKWLVGREWTLVTVENSYYEIYNEKMFKKILEQRLKEEFLISRIAYLTKENPMTVTEIAGKLGEKPEDVFRTIVEMGRKEKAMLVDFVNREPRYQTVR